MNFSLRNKEGFKPIKKYENFILFEKEVNGIKIKEAYNYCDLPDMSKEDKEWIERN